MNPKVLWDPRHYRLFWRTLKDIRHIGLLEFCRRSGNYLRKQLADTDSSLPGLEEGLAWLQTESMPPEPLTSPVTIVMPVYNGYVHLRRSVESVLAHTSGPYSLLLCDDGSEDPRVKAYLAAVESKWPQVSLLRSPENRGFVSTVNASMAHVKHHFVILNQDTEVPPGWLPRLLAPLLAGPGDVASVTPLSNAAGPCSFPRILEDNPLYAGLGITELDRFFRKVKPKPIEAPTGVGFCMAFNRDLVERIGLFDPAFGRGYGEENDWCRRAAALGYRHLIVPNLLVYHVHGAIFGEQKQKWLEINQQLLYRRHPDYLRQIDAFLRADLLSPMRALLPMIIRAATRQGCILWVDHSLGGGANHYTRQHQADEIEQGKGVLTLTCHPGQKSFRVSYRDRDTAFNYRMDDPKSLISLVDHLPLQRIHANSLVGFPRPEKLLDLIAELKRRSGAELVAYLHDYFPLCPRYTLLDEKGRFCELPAAEVCSTCLASCKGEYDLHFQHPVRDIATWRHHWEVFLGECDRIIAFSAISRDLLLRVWANLSPRVSVRPHQVPPIDVSLPGRITAIGVLGRISNAKGLPVLREMGRILALRGSRLKIVVIGEVTGRIDSKAITVTGPYRREDLPGLVERYRLSLFFLPSVWPETFCYTAEEVMAMGGYLAVFGLGAQEERVRNYARGRVLGSMEPLAALEEIVEWGKELTLWDETLLGTDPL